MFLFNQSTAYEMRVSDWSSDVCSSDLQNVPELPEALGVQDAVHGVHRAAVGLELDAVHPHLVAGLGLGVLERHDHAEVFTLGLPLGVEVAGEIGRAS